MPTTGRIVASILTGRDVDDASQVGPLLDQVTGAVASLTADGAYDQGKPLRQPRPAPSRRSRGRAATRDGGAERDGRDRAEAAVARCEQVIGDGRRMRSRKDECRATEVAAAVHALNRMLEIGRPVSVRIA